MLFSLLSLLSFILFSSSLLPTHVLFWPFFSHLFFSPPLSARSSHIFPSVLIYTEDLGKYAPRYLFFSLVELFQTKYVPLETSHGAALADGHRQTTETSSGILAIKVLWSYDGQIKTLQTESVRSVIQVKQVKRVKQVFTDSFTPAMSYAKSCFFLIWLECIDKFWEEYRYVAWRKSTVAAHLCHF